MVAQPARLAEVVRQVGRPAPAARKMEPEAARVVAREPAVLVVAEERRGRVGVLGRAVLAVLAVLVVLVVLVLWGARAGPWSESRVRLGSFAS